MQNMAMNMEELRILKGKILHHSTTNLRLLFSMIGFIQELQPASKVSNEELNSIINSVCCGATVGEG